MCQPSSCRREDQSRFEVLLDLPPGTSFEASELQVAEVERRILAVPEVRQVFTTVGVNGEVRRSPPARPHGGEARATAEPAGDQGGPPPATWRRVPFADVRVANPPIMQGAPTEAPIQVFLRGNDLPTLERLSDDLVRRARAIPGAVDVTSSLVGGHPEMVARVDRALASDMGFSVGAVALQLRGMVEGVAASKFRDGQTQYDIRVRLAPEFRNDFGAIGRAPLYSPTGAAVRVGDIVRMEPGIGPARIQREQRRRQARIEIDLDGRALGEVTADVEAALAAMAIPEGCRPSASRATWR